MKRQTNRGVTLLASLLALTLVGCAVGPDYQRPEFDLPSSWNAAPATGAEAARAADTAGQRWWSL